MASQELCNEYSSLPIVNTIEASVRLKVALIQVVPDDLRNYNIVLVTTNDEVFAIGDNTSGCLGVGHDKPVLEKVEPVKGLQGKSVVQISTGSRFVVVRTRYDELWSWGLNTSGQLGQTELTKPSSNVPTPLNLYFPKSTAVVKVVCGASFGVLLTAAGLVYTWGDNCSGQLGTGMPENQDEFNQIFEIDPVCEISCGAKHLVMLSNCKKKLFVCGDNRTGQLGLKGVTEKNRATVLILPFKQGESVRTIACGAAHTLVLLSNGMILAYGDNSSGQLGIALSKTTSTNVPHLIQEDEIFEQLFTTSLSNISAARSASAKERLYIWGPVRVKEAFKSLVDRTPLPQTVAGGAKDKQQAEPNGSKPKAVTTNILRRPRRAYIASVAKLFAVYEPMGLTFNGQLVSEGLRRTSSVTKCFNDKSQADVHFLLGSHILYSHKTVLATYSNYFHRYFDLEPIKSTTDAGKPSSIPICDYSLQVYRGYLHFIYTGLIFDCAYKDKWSEIEVIRYLVELAELALVYDETDLFEICVEELSSLMCPRLVTPIYNEVYRYHIGPLMNHCTKFIAEHWDQMQALPDFERWRLSMCKSTAEEDKKTPNERQ